MWFPSVIVSTMLNVRIFDSHIGCYGRGSDFDGKRCTFNLLDGRR